MKEKLKELIVERVEAVQGCKGMDLVMWVISNARYNPLAWVHSKDAREYGTPKFPEILAELVKEGKLVEVAYCLPTMPDREKSFYLPAGTIIQTTP